MPYDSSDPVARRRRLEQLTSGQRSQVRVEQFGPSIVNAPNVVALRRTIRQRLRVFADALDVEPVELLAHVEERGAIGCMSPRAIESWTAFDQKLSIPE